jgi:archaellum component FlaC
VNKLLGKNDIEDALKRLDTLTTEEARMATAENLRVTNRVDDKVDKVDGKVDMVDDKVGKVDDKVDEVDDKVGKVDVKVDKVDDKVDKVDGKVDEVDNKVTVLVDAADEEKSSYFDHIAVGPLDLLILTESKLREKLKNWLSPLDPSINHDNARKPHHGGTASWFFQGSNFKEWKSTASLMWVHGKRKSLFFYTTPHATDSHHSSGLR